MSFKDTLFSVKQTLNCGGTLIDFATPRVMGILNVTPDSFFDGGSCLTEQDILLRTSKLIEEGADIVDIGAYSSRPGAIDVTGEEELSRLKPALRAIRKKFPAVILSVDTFRATVAEYVVKEYGVNMINDISSGLMDANMIPTLGMLKVPYIMMHMQGTPQHMQVNPVYHDVTKELLAFFADRITVAKKAGINDFILDPGFGFGKTLDDNYSILKELELFELFGFPVMVGLSRKSMIYKYLDLTPEEALNGTTALHALALNNGARLLRVHDVKEAIQAIRLYVRYQRAGN
jgi:dihydropteroate synthase